jgi:hypothetical protein
MKRTIFQTLVIVGFILIFQTPLLSSADETIPPSVLDAAQEGIKIFFKDTKVTDLYRFGFSSREEADAATLGKGFQVFTVLPGPLLKEGTSKDLNSLAVSTTLWEFIVVSGGKAKVLLYVDLMSGKWTPVGIGAAGLAKEINKALETWPVSAGYQHKLIRVYQATSDFLRVSSGEKISGILPFTSARIAMDLKERGFDPLDLYQSGDVAARIQSTVRKNLQMGN